MKLDFAIKKSDVKKQPWILLSCGSIGNSIVSSFRNRNEKINKKIYTWRKIDQKSNFVFSIFLSSWNKKVKLEKYKNANFRKIILWLQPCWVWQTLIHQSRSLRFLSSFMKYKNNRGKFDLPKRLKSKSGFVVHFTIENTPKYPKIKIIYHF